MHQYYLNPWNNPLIELSLATFSTDDNDDWDHVFDGYGTNKSCFEGRYWAPEKFFSEEIDGQFRTYFDALKLMEKSDSGFHTCSRLFVSRDIVGTCNIQKTSMEIYMDKVFNNDVKAFNTNINQANRIISAINNQTKECFMPEIEYFNFDQSTFAQDVKNYILYMSDIYNQTDDFISCVDNEIASLESRWYSFSKNDLLELKGYQIKPRLIFIISIMKPKICLKIYSMALRRTQYLLI